MSHRNPWKQSESERNDEESIKGGFDYQNMSGVSDIYAKVLRLREEEEEKLREQSEEKLRPTNMESV